jgi:hypothetical protein
MCDFGDLAVVNTECVRKASMNVIRYHDGCSFDVIERKSTHDHASTN